MGHFSRHFACCLAGGSFSDFCFGLFCNMEFSLDGGYKKVKVKFSRGTCFSCDRKKGGVNSVSFGRIFEFRIFFPMGVHGCYVFGRVFPALGVFVKKVAELF